MVVLQWVEAGLGGTHMAEQHWQSLREKKSIRNAAGVLAGLSIGFLLSPWDAQFRGWIAAQVFESSFSSFRTGASVFGITAVIDGFTALGVYLGMRLNPGATAFLRKALQAIEPRKLIGLKKPKKLKKVRPRVEQAKAKVRQSQVGSAARRTIEFLRDVGASLGVGAGFTLIFKPPAVQEDVEAWKQIASSATKYTIFNSLFFGAVGYTAANRAIALAEGGNRGLSDFIVEWAPHWLPWTALTVTTLVGPWVAFGSKKASAKSGLVIHTEQIERGFVREAKASEATKAEQVSLPVDDPSLFSSASNATQSTFSAERPGPDTTKSVATIHDLSASSRAQRIRSASGLARTQGL